MAIADSMPNHDAARSLFTGMGRVIAIGALGGSGTRAVARIFMEAGVHLGDWLNQAHDNLLFTTLFKNPAFHDRATPAQVERRLELFKHYMEGRRLSAAEGAWLAALALGNPADESGRLPLARRALNRCFSSRPRRQPWGWKEPNTHIYLEAIDAHYPELKYVHVLRHGLDMALSPNKAQLFNWGHLFGIQAHGQMAGDELIYWQLEYWVRSTRRALELGRKMGDRFLLLNHAELVEAPLAQVRRLVEFAELELPGERLLHLAGIPSVPPTAGRWRNQDLGLFDAAQIEFVREMGFEA